MKTFTILILAILLLSSCDKLFTKTPKVSNICLVDISGSINNTNIDFYLENIQKEIIPFLNKNNSLTVLAIDNGSETAATPLFQVDLSIMNFENSSHPVTIRKKMGIEKRNKYLIKLNNEFINIVKNKITARKKYSNRTDIFGSLKQVKRYSKDITNVIIFSDMLNYSTDSDMEKTIKRKVDLKSLLNKVPNIKSNDKTKVYVCTGDNTSLGGKTYNNIKSFWELYFSRNNYQLVDYTSAYLNIKNESN